MFLLLHIELDINGSQITVEIAGISGVKNPVQGEVSYFVK